MKVFRLHRCWWRMLESKCVGDKFVILVTDAGYWWPIKYIGKITNIAEKVADIMILLQTSEINHHHKVTNITVTRFLNHIHIEIRLGKLRLYSWKCWLMSKKVMYSVRFDSLNNDGFLNGPIVGSFVGKSMQLSHFFVIFEPSKLFSANHLFFVW